MHQTRSESTTKLPITRKGTKYVARALIAHRDSVPVVIALRDMLGLAANAKEVKEMIKDKIISINWRQVFDYRESVQLFSILTVGGKNYVLSFTETGKFTFSESKESKKRLCKVIGKRLVNGNKIQINLHDGTNIIGTKSMNTNDSLYIDSDGKVSKHIPLSEAKEVFVIHGKYIGQHGVLKAVKEGSAIVSFKEGSATLPLRSIIAI